jgi:hypothetical protein
VDGGCCRLIPDRSARYLFRTLFHSAGCVSFVCVCVGLCVCVCVSWVPRYATKPREWAMEGFARRQDVGIADVLIWV